MESISQSPRRALARVIFRAFIIAVLGSVATGAHASTLPHRAQQNQGDAQPKSGAPQITDAERQAIKKINETTDPKAELDEAAIFVKKFPKSKILDRVAAHVAVKISEVQDATQKLALCESFSKVFKDTGHAGIITPTCLTALVVAKKMEDAFKMAAPWLESHPNDLLLLTRMALVGADEAKHNNSAYVAQSEKWGEQAIAIIEAGNKPETLGDAEWHDYQTKLLGSLYQSMGLLQMMSNNKEGARKKLQRSAEINPDDPFSYAFLGGLLNDEYQEAARKYLDASVGAEKDSLRKKAVSLLEKVVEAYAHSVALSENKPEYQQLHDQILEDLTGYYKFLHNNSTQGMQEYINTFKKA